jgi:hypothetical protein
MHECAITSQSYGHGVVELGVVRAFFRKRPDAVYSNSIIAKRGLKPRVCKMWPFIVLRDQVYGRVYVYIDPRCPRIILGKRSPHFSEKVLPEFVDIEFGRKGSRLHSTHELHRMSITEVMRFR